MNEDLIRRSDAIKSLDNAWINGTSLLDANEAVKQLNDLPSADRSHGEWIADTDDSCGGITLTCSECGEQFNFDDADEVLDFKEHAHFCINCGAKIGGDKECL